MATRIWSAGFETGDIREVPYQARVATAPTASTTQKQTGSYALRFSGGYTPVGASFAAATDIAIAAWLYHAGVGTDNAYIVSFYNQASQTHAVRYNPTANLIELLVNGSVVASVDPATANIARTLTWMQIGALYRCHATDGVFRFYVDGNEVLSFTGATLASPLTAACIGGSPASSGWVAYAYFDDFYIDDVTGDPDGPPVARKFLPMVPNAAGQNTQWTPSSAVANYTTVDEVPTNTTDYVQATSTGLKDTYNFGDPTLPAGYVPTAVIVTPVCQRASSTEQIRVHIYDGANYSDGADLTPPAAYGVPGQSRFATQVNGSAWDATSLNSLQAGVESRGTFS